MKCRMHDLFKNAHRAERMQKRLQQWGTIGLSKLNLWNPPRCKGQEAAKELKPLQVHQLWKTIRKLSNKAAGLDGAGYDCFRELPYQAMPELIALFHEIEAQATIPQQWTTALIALLPKNKDIERPIALVASLYRLWCKVRAPYTKQWQLNGNVQYQVQNASR